MTWTEGEKEVIATLKRNLDDARYHVRSAIINVTKLRSCYRDVQSLNSILQNLDQQVSLNQDRLAVEDE